MKAGKLWHEITIEEKTLSRNTHGDQVPSWSTFANCYAELKNMRGAELVTSDQVNSKTTTSFIIRYLTGLRTDMRIKTVIDTNIVLYNIVYIDRVEGKDEMIEILCQRFEDPANG